MEVASLDMEVAEETEQVAEVGNTVDNEVGKVGDGGEEPPGQLFLVEVNGLVAGLETGSGEKCKESS